jgi:YidC/Oxa1 family membrane protein insertase
VEKRAVLAAVLMFAMLMVYQYVFAPAPDPPPSRPGETTQASGERALAPTGGQAPAVSPAPPAPAQAPSPMPAPPVPQREAVIETPLYRARIGSSGGALREWTVKFHGDKALIHPGVFGPGGIVVERQGGKAQPVEFSLSTERLSLGPEQPEGVLELVGEDGFGLRITERLRFRADQYAVEGTLRIENRQPQPQQAQVGILWRSAVEWPKEEERFSGARPIHVVRLGPEAAWTTRQYLTDAGGFHGQVHWIGLETGIPSAGQPIGQSGLFLAALVPAGKGLSAFERQLAEAKQLEFGLSLPVGTLQAGQAWEGRVTTYIGPMEYDRLKMLGVGLEQAIYFGGFPFPESWAARWGVPTLPMRWIAVPILKLLAWVYSFTVNYGVAIIVLTVITKVLFFPLTVMSMRSMKAMQALQPQINALRAKHRNDPRRVQQETMDLYRQHGVNPLGGCLPMLVQIPIFYALYVALVVSTEMQNASFICFGRLPSWVPWLGGQSLWICDLAAQDPTYVLPVLMGVTMFIQQKMTPTVGDPRQAKMMLMMPVVFTFFFLSLPSGLVLYWTISNVLQIGQQYYLDRTARAGAAGAEKPAKPSRAARKA